MIIIQCVSFILSLNISPCAKWNKTGITVAGITDQSGDSNYHLNSPLGIFIRQSTNTLYVADMKNNRIQMFPLDQSSAAGITVIKTETSPHYIYIDEEDNGPVIYISLHQSNRVEKWTHGATAGIQVGDHCITCDDIVVDKEKNLYMVEAILNRLRQWSPKTNTTELVAGGIFLDMPMDERLHMPQGIDIDKNDGSLYIADTGNDRIQRWPKDAKKGITVAGSLSVNPDERSRVLNGPNTVIVDEENYLLYILEERAHRVQRWFINATEGETIIGRKGILKYFSLYVY